MKLIKKILLFLVGIIFLLLVILGILTLAINVYMINYSKEYIVTEEELEEKTFDCIVVLGASVKSNGNGGGSPVFGQGGGTTTLYVDEILENVKSKIGEL